MANRLTDTDKWKKPFLRGLDAPCKLLWFYICDDCDHAGIWQVDMQVAEIRTGEKLDQTSVIKMLGDKIVVFDGGQKWFIPSFITYQYKGGLNPGNRVHDSVLQILQKYNLIQHLEDLISPFQGVKDKDKDIDKDMEQDKDIPAPTTKPRRPLKKTQEVERQKALKEEFDLLTAECAGKPDKEVFAAMKGFIQDKRPAFPEPYVDVWNIFAPNYSLSLVQEITAERREKIRLRSREPAFDFFKILGVIRQHKWYTGDNDRGWKVGFDYIIRSEAVYVEMIEKYRESA